MVRLVLVVVSILCGVYVVKGITQLTRGLPLDHSPADITAFRWTIFETILYGSLKEELRWAVTDNPITPKISKSGEWFFDLDDFSVTSSQRDSAVSTPASSVENGPPITGLGCDLRLKSPTDGSQKNPSPLPSRRNAGQEWVYLLTSFGAR